MSQAVFLGVFAVIGILAFVVLVVGGLYCLIRRNSGKALWKLLIVLIAAPILMIIWLIVGGIILSFTDDGPESMEVSTEQQVEIVGEDAE